MFFMLQMIVCEEQHVNLDMQSQVDPDGSLGAEQLPGTSVGMKRKTSSGLLTPAASLQLAQVT